MKKLFLLLILLNLILPSQIYSQITLTKSDGGSVLTELGYNVVVNMGSTLVREKIILNDANCLIQLDSVGINTAYANRKYSFYPVGSINIKEPIAAFKIHHVLYDVFGDHMKTLSNKEIKDMEGSIDISKSASWYASGNNVSNYLICVSYVSKVRTKSGQLWHCDFEAIKKELAELKIEFSEGFLPNKNNKDK